MQEFRDRVAVITGAASGIGRALAYRCAQEGMKVVLADIEESTLTKTAQDIEVTGATTLAVLTDVSDPQAVETLAQRTLSTFGAVHLLCNNAGIGIVRSLLNSTLADWTRIMGVNLWGVIHGVHFFLPIMHNQDVACHIVNTASIAALNAGAFLGSYRVTKHGVVSLSETLYYELAEQGSKVKISALCPSYVKTSIMDAAYKHEHQHTTTVKAQANETLIEQELRQAITEGLAPEEVASCVFTAIRNEQLYIFTHPESKKSVQERMEYILNERNPSWST